MNRITVSVQGQERLVASMGRVAADAKARVKRTMTMLGLMLVTHIQTTKLRGQRLNQRSGRLISSIHEETTESSGGLINTTVGTNVVYARPHEYGIRQTVQVKAHYRMIKQAFGRPITPKQVMVRAHPLRMDLTERRYMRDSLAEFKPKAEERLARLATELAQEVNTR